jgi:hypothetical protein
MIATIAALTVAMVERKTLGSVMTRFGGAWTSLLKPEVLAKGGDVGAACE